MKMLYNVMVCMECEIEVPPELQFYYLKDEDDFTEAEWKMFHSHEWAEQMDDIIKRSLGEDERIIYVDHFSAIREI